MERSLYVLAVLALLGSGMVSAQDGGCRLSVKAEENGLLSLEGKPLGPPVIWGDAVTVPSFPLRFVDAKTRAVLKPAEVSISYGWKWLQYPYPEHSWGAWSSASDIVSCAESGSPELLIPQFQVKPRGWYKGKFTRFPFSRKPSFNGVGITATVPGCSTRAAINSKEAMSLAGRTVAVNVDCHGESTISYAK